MSNSNLLIVPAQGPSLGSEADATDLVGQVFSCGAYTVAIPVARLDPQFLDLSTGMAGEFMRKFVIYQIRLAFVGEMTAALQRSGPLRDFVRESNRGNDVWFVDTMSALEQRLGGGSAAAPGAGADTVNTDPQCPGDTSQHEGGPI